MMTGKVSRAIAGCCIRKGNVKWGYHYHALESASEPIYLAQAPEREAFKYVSIEHADAVQSGSFKIGTLRSFARVEDRRADAGEGLQGLTSGTALRIKGVVGHDVDIAHLRYLGLACDLGASVNLLIDNNTCFAEMSDMYALCFQRHSDTPDDCSAQQAIFKVSDLYELAWRISEAAPQLGAFALGVVSYQDRVSVYPEGLGRPPSPFIKPKSFVWEQERRIVWMPNSPPDSIEPFLVHVDVTGLIERVR